MAWLNRENDIKWQKKNLFAKKGQEKMPPEQTLHAELPIIIPLCKMNVIMGLRGKIIVTNQSFGELLTHYNKNSPQCVNNLPKVSL